MEESIFQYAVVFDTSIDTTLDYSVRRGDPLGIFGSRSKVKKKHRRLYIYIYIYIISGDMCKVTITKEAGFVHVRLYRMHSEEDTNKNKEKTGFVAHTQKKPLQILSRHIISILFRSIQTETETRPKNKAVPMACPRPQTRTTHVQDFLTPQS